nr:hypothetical protein [uncultured Cohaesibacter sp.]
MIQDEDHPKLKLALTYWEEGLPAPVDVETALLQLGYDVSTLEQHHRI